MSQNGLNVDKIITETTENLKINDNENGEDKSETDKSKSTENLNIDPKQRKKIDKFIDSTFRKSGLNALPSFEDKFYALAEKYSELLDASKIKDIAVKEGSKTMQMVIKQRDQLQNDCSKAILAKNKLEDLCRELQKHNKAIREENLSRIKDEEEKRREIATKFQAAIDEMNQQLNSNTERNASVLHENEQLAVKFKTLSEQFELREQHYEKIMKHKDLENQLMNAKFQQSELRVAEIGEKVKKYEEYIANLNKKCEYHMSSEAQLKAQLAVYTEKYEEFQTTLNKSNDVFNSFKTEIDKMNKKVKKFENETTQWRNKYENANKALLKELENREALEKESKKRQLRADTMEQLSRTLQTERTTLLLKIKELEKPVSPQDVHEVTPEAQPVDETEPKGQAEVSASNESVQTQAAVETASS